MNAGDQLTGTSGRTDSLNIRLLNAGGAVGTGTAATRQVETVTVLAATAGATDLINVTIGGTVYTTAAAGLTTTTAAVAIAATINAVLGAGTAVAALAVVTVTAPVGGVAIPNITTAAITAVGAASTGGTIAVAVTTANGAASGSAISFGNTTAVEVLNLTNTSGQTARVNVDNALASATEVNIVASTNTSAFTNIQTAVKTLGMSNITTDNVDVTYTYAAGLTGTTDALTYNVSGVQSATVPASSGNFPDVTISGAAAGSGFDIVNVNATGANRLNTFIINDGAAATTLQTLNIAGTGSFRVNSTLAFAGGAGTVNASTNTGGVNLMFGAEVTTATGGSGNDRFAFATAGDFTTADTLNGGTGTDTLAIADLAVSAATTGLNAAINNAVSFEVLEFRGASMTVDASVLPQFNTYNFTGPTAAGATTGVTVTEISGDVVGITRGSAIGGVTLTPTLGVTTATLNISTPTTTAINLEGLTTTGLTTLALSSTGLATNLTGAITNDANTTITVTGSSTGLTMGTLAAAAIVNASAFTGNFGVTGSAAADSLTGSATGINTIVGGAGNDVIVGGSASDSLTGGVGADVINGGNAIDTFNIAVATDSLATGIVAGSSLTQAYLATLVNNTWDTYTVTAGDIVDTDIAAALVVSNAGTTPLIAGQAAVANGMTFWNNGTNTYVMINSAASADYTAADTLIVLSGVRTVEAVGALGAFQVIS